MTNAADSNFIEQFEQYIDQHRIRRIRVGYSDFNGLMRGKLISIDKCLSALKNGMGFYDGIIGCSLQDDMIPDLQCTGWHSGFADSKLEIVTNSCRHIPFEEHTLFFLTEMASPNDSICPRQILKRVVKKAEDMGFIAKASVEYEFTAFEETPRSLNNKSFINPTPFTTANCGYSVLRSVTESELHTGLMDLCDAMDFSLDGLHSEEGPGFLEAAIIYDDALKAGDKAALFKTFSKAYAQRLELCFSFMAKWSTEYQGQGGHTHVSLLDLDNNPAFFDKDQPNTISKTMRHFIAGQQQLMPELMAFIAPNVNSFTRLVPGFWAPTAATWGIDNRTCALRAITGSAKAQRVEYRVPGADCNPYFSIAVALASGLYGIEHQLEPSAAIEGNAYEQDHGNPNLPTNLHDAAQALRQSKAARELFGDMLIDDYATTREWEALEASKQITDWQLRRYLELT
ncbi:MAG: glutamine synthetase [Coxiellaceae bacterium]|nr:glutamine synthetase [Coxiellaceae bacterium]